MVGKRWCMVLLAAGALAGSATLRAATSEPSAARGGDTFGIYCAACHGQGAAGGFGPSLTNLANRKDKRAVADIIRKPSPSMPPLYPATINDGDVADIEAYLNSLQPAQTKGG